MEFCPNSTWAMLCLSLCALGMMMSELDHGLMRYLVHVSYRQCVQECDDRPNCFVAEYTRRFTLCELYEEENLGTEMVLGITIYHKPITGTCTSSHCATTTVPDHCDQPRRTVGTEILGNMPGISSKIRYQCVDGSGWTTSECLHNGSWSSVDGFKCKCSEPLDNNNIPLAHVDRWQFKNDSSNHVKAVPICKEGYYLTSDNSAVCDVESGTWSSLEDLCCDKLLDGDLIKIYSLPSTNTTKGILNSWRGGNNQTAYCQFRNEGVISNWETKQPSIVNVTVLKEDVVVSWITFKGEGTTYTNWFTVDNLNASSWGYLTKDVNDLHITWDAPSRTPSVKFYVGSFDTLSTQTPVGYLMVTKFNLSSSGSPYEKLPKTMIFYSQGEEMTELGVTDAVSSTSRVGFADRLEIWVKY